MLKAVVEVAVARKLLDVASRRPSNVEAFSRAGVSAFSPPIDEAPHQIGWVKGTGGEERVGEGQCHGGIVSPLPGLKAEGAASDHLRMVRSCVSRTELDRGAQRITDRKSQERAYGAVNFLLGDLFGGAVLVQWRGSIGVHAEASEAIGDRPAPALVRVAGSPNKVLTS